MSKILRLLTVSLLLAIIMIATVAGGVFAADGGQVWCWGETSEGEGDDPDVCLENRWGQTNDVAFAAGGNGQLGDDECPGNRLVRGEGRGHGEPPAPGEFGPGLLNRWGQPNDVAFAAGGPNSSDCPNPDCPNPDCPRDGIGPVYQHGHGPQYQYRLGQG